MRCTPIRVPLRPGGLWLMLFLLCACRAARVQHVGSAEQAPSTKTAGLSLAMLGSQVPDFILPSITSSSVRLSDYRGKVVVLEWLNPSCPFTSHAHKKGLLKDYPAQAMGQGVIWLGINSGADLKMGGSLEATQRAVEDWGIQFPVLRDLDGHVGRQFDATMTPEVFLIDTRGVLVYVGALDNMPFGKVRGGGEGQNYLAQALEQLLAGEPLEPNHRQAYGCRVKYAQPTRQD